MGEAAAIATVQRTQVRVSDPLTRTKNARRDSFVTRRRSRSKEVSLVSVWYFAAPLAGREELRQGVFQ
jgi:hypothetical protein